MLQRSNETAELVKDPNAFALTTIIALRAQRNGAFNAKNLEIGEALIGDCENYGMTPKAYRIAKEKLEKWGIAAFRGTNKGTIAKLCDNRVYDLNLEAFESAYTGNLYGAGLDVFALLPWIISHKDEQGLVEINPVLVAQQLGCTVEQIQHALDYLLTPDPKSRTPDHDGRRLLKLGPFLYKVVNHQKYSNWGRDQTAYWKDYRQKKRASMRTGAHRQLAKKYIREPLLNAREVGHLLQLSTGSIYRLAARGDLPKPIILGRNRYRWRPDQLNEFLQPATSKGPSK